MLLEATSKDRQCSAPDIDTHCHNHLHEIICRGCSCAWTWRNRWHCYVVLRYVTVRYVGSTHTRYIERKPMLSPLCIVVYHPSTINVVGIKILRSWVVLSTNKDRYVYASCTIFSDWQIIAYQFDFNRLTQNWLIYSLVLLNSLQP